MNTIILIGRLTSDPELKFFSSGTAISKCTIAIDRNYKKDNQTVTDFIPIEVWGKQAEYAATCLEKGYLIAVSGSLHIDRYIDPSGNNKSYAKVIAKTITKLNVPKSSLGLLNTATNNTQSDSSNTLDNSDNNQTNSQADDETNASANASTNGQTNSQTNGSSNYTPSTYDSSDIPTAAEVDSQIAKLVEEGCELPF